MKRLTRFSAYRQAILAILLPATIPLGHAVGILPRVYDILMSQPATRRLLIGTGIAVFVLEAAYLPTLFRLIQARGDVAKFNARRNTPKQIARTRRWRFGVVTAALATIVSLLVVELVFRLFDIRPPDVPRYQDAQSEKVRDKLNALGLREEWDGLSAGDSRLRIVMLGDSITYGNGVEAHETFCHLSEELLADSTPEGVVTINMSESATGPGHQLRELYLPLRDQLKPDVVVHIVYVNDMGIDSRRFLLRIHRIRDDELWVGNSSYLLSFAERRIRYWVAWNSTIDYFRGGRSTKERARTWARFESDMRACKAAVEESGAVYAIVMFPWLNRLEDYLLRDLHDNMRELAAGLEVPYLDLLDVFAGRDDESFRLSLQDEHPNAAAHRLAAAAIADFLRDEIIPSLSR